MHDLRRSPSCMTLEDDVPVGGEVGVPLVDRPDWAMNCPRDPGFIPFGLFAHVDEQRPGLDAGGCVVHVDGGHLRLADHGLEVTG